MVQFPATSQPTVPLMRCLSGPLPAGSEMEGEPLNGHNELRQDIEAAVAHVVRNRVEAAYARSDLFDRRRVLIDDWARYLA